MEGPGRDATCVLPDGRTLDYWEGGDPDGKAVLYHGGTPCTRVFGRTGHETALDNGVRLGVAQPARVRRVGHPPRAYRACVATQARQQRTSPACSESASTPCSAPRAASPFAVATAVADQGRGSAAQDVVGGVGPWRAAQRPVGGRRTPRRGRSAACGRAAGRRWTFLEPGPATGPLISSATWVGCGRASARPTLRVDASLRRPHRHLADRTPTTGRSGPKDLADVTRHAWTAARLDHFAWRSGPGTSIRAQGRRSPRRSGTAARTCICPSGPDGRVVRRAHRGRRARGLARRGAHRGSAPTPGARSSAPCSTAGATDHDAKLARHALDLLEGAAGRRR